MELSFGVVGNGQRPDGMPAAGFSRSYAQQAETLGFGIVLPTYVHDDDEYATSVVRDTSRAATGARSRSVMSNGSRSPGRPAASESACESTQPPAFATSCSTRLVPVTVTSRSSSDLRPTWSGRCVRTRKHAPIRR